MFEHHKAPLLPFHLFALRVARNGLFGAAVMLVALGLGMIGYHVTEGLSWIDSFANASMILSGMGPLATLQTASGKLFAGCYALFSGLAFITIMGFVFAPVIHRFFHKFHLQEDAEEKRGDEKN